MSRDVNMPFGVVIVHDELTWGHVQQTVLLQGKVLGGCCGRFRDRLLLTSRSFRILARLKAFSDYIFSVTRLLGWKVVTKVILGVSNGLCEHLRAREQSVFFCEREQ